MSASERAMIQSAADAVGLVPNEWDENGADGLTAMFGRWVAKRDDPREAFYEGDVEDLTACVVGAEKYRNQRVLWSFGEIGEIQAGDIFDLLDRDDD